MGFISFILTLFSRWSQLTAHTDYDKVMFADEVPSRCADRCQ